MKSSIIISNERVHKRGEDRIFKVNISVSIDCHPRIATMRGIYSYEQLLKGAHVFRGSRLGFQGQIHNTSTMKRYYDG